MESLANFVSHHTALVPNFLSIASIASYIVFWVYRKRHGLPPSRRTGALVVLVLVPLILFAGFVVGVMTPHS